MRNRAVHVRLIVLAALVSCLAIASGAGSALAGAPAQAATPTFTSTVFASGDWIDHSGPSGTEAVSTRTTSPRSRGDVFVAFQNGVGPQGQASASGQPRQHDRRVLLGRRKLRQWDIAGKCDGLTADPQTGKLIATVNEDANSSVYLIDPLGPTVPVHYHYDIAAPAERRHRRDLGLRRDDPDQRVRARHDRRCGAAGLLPGGLPGRLPSAGHVAHISPLFYDEALARGATLGNPYFPTRIQLALTDPDSNEVVPIYAHALRRRLHAHQPGRSGADLRQQPRTANQRLSVLTLTASVDDTAWPSDSSGELSHDRQRRQHDLPHHRAVPPGPGVRRSDAVRREQRAWHLSRSRLPAELRRPAEPVHRRADAGDADRAGAAGPGHAVPSVTAVTRRAAARPAGCGAGPCPACGRRGRRPHGCRRSRSRASPA